KRKSLRPEEPRYTTDGARPFRPRFVSSSLPRPLAWAEGDSPFGAKHATLRGKNRTTSGQRARPSTPRKHLTCPTTPSNSGTHATSPPLGEVSSSAVPRSG